MQTDEPQLITDGEAEPLSARSRAAIKRAQKANNIGTAVRLRAEGMSFVDIGERLGAHPQTVKVWIQEGIKRTPFEGAEDARALELQRLDMLVKGHMPLAMRGDDKSAMVILKAMERRAKFLNLDEQASAGLEQVGSLLDRLIGTPPEGAAA